MMKKVSLYEVNEHFKLFFNAELASAIVVQQPAKAKVCKTQLPSRLHHILNQLEKYS